LHLPLHDLPSCPTRRSSDLRGGAFVTRERKSSQATSVTLSTARLKVSSFALEGLVKPLSFRTNCRADARISSSVAGGAKLCRVLDRKSTRLNSSHVSISYAV